MQKRRVVAAVVTVLAMVIAVGACGSGSSGKESAPTGAGENTFGLSEFVINPPSNDLHAGSVSLTANNVGGEEHELVIVRADDAKSLPTKPDGSVDEAKIPASDMIGEIAGIAAQSRKSETFELAAGNYVALCNLVDSMMGSSTTMTHGDTGMMHDDPSVDEMGDMGHVHFAKGMSVAFSVN